MGLPEASRALGIGEGDEPPDLLDRTGVSASLCFGYAMTVICCIVRVLNGSVIKYLQSLRHQTNLVEGAFIAPAIHPVAVIVGESESSEEEAVGPLLLFRLGFPKT